MLVILDISVIIAYLLSKNISYSKDIVKLATLNEITLVACKETFHELQNTLGSTHVKKLPNFKNNQIGRFVAWYKYNAKFVLLPQQSESTRKIRDSNDIIYILLAEVANAAYLITHDKDLLVLKEIYGTKIVTPKEFLEA